MKQLKEKLGQITGLIPQDKPVAYFDFPTHMNIGDLLIMQGTERFFREHQYQVILRASHLNYSSALVKKIPADATIVLHGGGNFGDLYPVLQAFRERIIADFPKNKIVLLPQTVHFSTPLAKLSSATRFKWHDDLTLLVRDEISYEELIGTFSESVCLMPDMAHQLWEDDYLPPRSMSQRTLHLMRQDIEVVGDQEMRSEQGRSADWSDLISLPRKKAFNLISRALRAEGRLARQFGTVDVWYWFCDGLVNEMRRIFERHDTVVTSRMHAVIFAALLKKDVRFIDNSYGKLGRYYEKWLKDVDGVAPLV